MAIHSRVETERQAGRPGVRGGRRGNVDPGRDCLTVTDFGVGGGLLGVESSSPRTQLLVGQAVDSAETSTPRWRSGRPAGPARPGQFGNPRFSRPWPLIAPKSVTVRNFLAIEDVANSN